MVDAFPLPRHREKLCCSRSPCSHKEGKLTYRAARSQSVTKNCVVIIRAIMADIQRGAEQLQISMTVNNYDSSNGNNSSENAWRKLPKMGKKTFDGWPVRELSKRHVSPCSTPAPIDEAYPNGNKRHPRNFDEDTEAHGGYGPAQPTPSSQNTSDQPCLSSTQLISPITSQASNLEDLDVIGVLQTPLAASSLHHHGYPNSLTTFSMPLSPLSRSNSTSSSPLRERIHVHPIEWTVEETVNWLRLKGFEDTVCEKFIEQETTGDALLNLNAASLKTEIGIDAYGKRFRLANAIDDLRRVASVKFPSVKSTWSRTSSQAAQQRSGLKPLLLQSSCVADPMSPSAQPNSFHLPKTPILSPCREPDLDVPDIVQQLNNSDAKTGEQGRISPSHSPGSGQGKTVLGRSLRLPSYRSDGTLGVSVTRDGWGRGKRLQADSDTTQLAPQKFDPQSDSGSSSSSTRMPLSPSMDIGTPRPRIRQLKGRSQSMREWRSGRLGTQYGMSSTSTLVGTAGLISKSRQDSPGNSIGSVPTPSVNANIGNRKEDKNEKHGPSGSWGSKDMNSSPLRRSVSCGPNATEANTQTQANTVLVQIGTPDHEGWIRKKGGHFSTWKSRYLVLKGAHLYWLRTDSTMSKVEGHVNIASYRVVPDETIGSYGFKLLHGSDRVHLFSSDDQTIIREWVKALRKPSIRRDHLKVMAPSAYASLVSLDIARAMNPRPPSPTTAAETQRNQRRENLKQLYARNEKTLNKMHSFHRHEDNIPGPSRAGSNSSGLMTNAPVRPPRNARRGGPQLEHQFAEQALIKWATSHIPGTQINRNCNGPELLRIAESIKEIEGSCTPKSTVPNGPDHETLEALFALVDFLLSGDAKSGADDIDDALWSKRGKVFQLLKGLRAWEEHRVLRQPIGMNEPQEGTSDEGRMGNEYSESRSDN